MKPFSFWFCIELENNGKYDIHIQLLLIVNMNTADLKDTVRDSGNEMERERERKRKENRYKSVAGVTHFHNY